ncbi:hypothetical protein KAR91_34450 [Candidatus Pacearchaeota archaeon]|nr:hypothetical protein [Candidatus Pacearchaeota archaeon]
MVATKYHYHLEWFNKEKTFGVARAYLNPGDTDYWGVATIVKRNGLHEPLAWLTKEGSPIDYHADSLMFLMSQGLRVAWTFEVDKFHLYKRVLGKAGELKILKTFEKEYNGTMIRFHYGEIIHRE